MSPHRLEVADVFRNYADAFLATQGESISSGQRRVLRAIGACRTAALGGHKRRCNACGHEVIAYNSCRNRHCPKCQAMARAKWLEARSAELLPVEYFHVIFTLPAVFAPLALQNKQVMYSILFRATAATLLQIAADPKRLGARIGFLAVLHTWGQNLLHHPHVHCVVPGGGLSLDGSRWVSCRAGFFLPVRILSRVFRGKFMAMLREAYRSAELQFHGQLAGLSRRERFEEVLHAAFKTEWVVYAKPPFGGPERVLKYLARYTHRVAISNQRLVSLVDGKVSFRWKDYRRQSRERTMTLDATEFIRRFLLHVLPAGFMRIRQYGLLANRLVRKKLELCRRLIGQVGGCHSAALGDDQLVEGDATDQETKDTPICPACKKGRMAMIEKIEPLWTIISRVRPGFDSS